MRSAVFLWSSFIRPCLSFLGARQQPAAGIECSAEGRYLATRGERREPLITLIRTDNTDGRRSEGKEDKRDLMNITWSAGIKSAARPHSFPFLPHRKIYTLSFLRDIGRPVFAFLDWYHCFLEKSKGGRAGYDMAIDKTSAF